MDGGLDNVKVEMRLGLQYLRLGLDRLLYASSRRRRPRWPVLAKGVRIGVWGWYGTETHGDRAVLGALLSALREALPDAVVTIFSYDAGYTEDSVRQVGLEGVAVRPNAGRFWADCDVLLIGGGPLMEDAEMRRWFKVVAAARVSGVPTIVYGCSIGPLRSATMSCYVRWIVELAALRFVRDEASRDLAVNLLGVTVPVEVSPDPAFGFAAPAAWTRRPGDDAEAPSGDSEDGWTVGVCARTWPDQYDDRRDPGLHHARWNDFKLRLAEALDILADKHHARIEFVAMHRLGWDDDRRVGLEVMARMRHWQRATLQTGTRNLRATLDRIRGCDVFIGMRYHSTVFAAGVGCPVLGIEYTVGGGKVVSFFRSLGMERWAFPIAEFKPKELVDAVLEARRNRVALGCRLQERLRELGAEANRPARALAAQLRGEQA